MTWKTVLKKKKNKTNSQNIGALKNDNENENDNKNENKNDIENESENEEIK